MTDNPKRIQRRRTKGWRMPPNTVYVGRPTKWGNPFMVSQYSGPLKAVNWYRERIDHGGPTTEEIRRELKGKNLACWCGLDEPCHADVLLEIANE